MQSTPRTMSRYQGRLSFRMNKPLLLLSFRLQVHLVGWIRHEFVSRMFLSVIKVTFLVLLYRASFISRAGSKMFGISSPYERDRGIAALRKARYREFQQYIKHKLFTTYMSQISGKWSHRKSYFLLVSIVRVNNSRAGHDSSLPWKMEVVLRLILVTKILIGFFLTKVKMVAVADLEICPRGPL